MESSLIITMTMMIAMSSSFCFSVYFFLGSVLSTFLYYPVSLLQPCELITLFLIYE